MSIKKIASALAFLPVAAMAAGDNYPAALPGDVDTALASVSSMGAALAAKVGPVLMGVGIAFLGVAVVWWGLNCLGGFLRRRKGV